MKFAVRENLVQFWENLKNLLVFVEEDRGLSTNDLTDDLKTEYDDAYDHSQSTHAPSSAQVNVLEQVDVNGNTLYIHPDKTVDIEMPTKVSDLINDEGYLTEHPEITKSVDTTSSITTGDADQFSFVCAVDKDEFGHIISLKVKTVKLPESFDHPVSVIVPGTYRSVTVDSNGHLSAGSNPTTRDGYGLTDVPTFLEMAKIIDDGILNAEHLKREYVMTLCEAEDADPFTIYVVPKDEQDEENNICVEWMVINGQWEKLGDTAVDLSEYAMQDEINIASEREIDDMMISDEEAVQAIFALLEWDSIKLMNVVETDVSTDIILPRTGKDLDPETSIDTVIDWQSNNPAISVNADGKVTRPAYTTGDQVVTLVATIIKNMATIIRTFVLIISKLDPTDMEAVSLTKEFLTWDQIKQLNTIPDDVQTNLNLLTSGLHGAKITWQSSDPSVIATNGTVTRPTFTQGDKNVTLTATITRDDD